MGSVIWDAAMDMAQTAENNGWSFMLGDDNGRWVTLNMWNGDYDIMVTFKAGTRKAVRLADTRSMCRPNGRTVRRFTNAELLRIIGAPRPTPVIPVAEVVPVAEVTEVSEVASVTFDILSRFVTEGSGIARSTQYVGMTSETNAYGIFRYLCEDNEHERVYRLVKRTVMTDGFTLFETIEDNEPTPETFPTGTRVWWTDYNTPSGMRYGTVVEVDPSNEYARVVEYGEKADRTIIAAVRLTQVYPVTIHTVVNGEEVTIGHADNMDAARTLAGIRAIADGTVIDCWVGTSSKQYAWDSSEETLFILRANR